ncbi:hypothetical protein K504DRAFT_348974, partial [Pleomassaria siparia CBS 279.74]
LDLYWMMREKNYLLWFSKRMNQVFCVQDLDASHLDIRLGTYVTQKRKETSIHVFRRRFEKYRTDSLLYSPTTRLKNPTQFGRPDLALITEKQY